MGFVPRKPRLELEPGIHHVYARGNRRQVVYRDDVDRRIYLGMLGRVVVRMAWRCLAYCLMDNHMHLLVETTRANLGVGMHRLHGGYAQRFNHRHRITGHVFEGRYGSVRVESDAQLFMATAYIARNPVEASLCDRADEWPWSSHVATLRGPAPPWLDVDHLLAYIGAAGGEPRQRYAALTQARTGAREG